MPSNLLAFLVLAILHLCVAVPISWLTNWSIYDVYAFYTSLFYALLLYKTASGEIRLADGK